MRKRYYVGAALVSKGYEVFTATEKPTEKSHGKTYNYVIGPFKTKRGAEFMRDHGRGNPHCCTVAEAEKLAKKYIKQG